MTLCLFVFWEEEYELWTLPITRQITYLLFIHYKKNLSLSKTRSQMFVKWNRNSSSRKKRDFFKYLTKRSLMITGVDMKFKSKPIKIEQDSCTSSGSDLDIAEAMRSLSPLPRSSIHQSQPQSQQLQPQDDSLSDLEQNNNPNLTKLPSPSPIRKWYSS